MEQTPLGFGGQVGTTTPYFESGELKEGFLRDGLSTEAQKGVHGLKIGYDITTSKILTTGPKVGATRMKRPKIVSPSPNVGLCTTGSWESRNGNTKCELHGAKKKEMQRCYGKHR